MQLFVNAATINQPGNWPGGTAWNPNQHKLAAVVLDGDHFRQRRDAFTAGYTILVVDESTILNIPRGDDLFNHMGHTDAFGLEKYYVDSANPQNLWERQGWIEAPQTYTPNPAQDILVTPTRSLEKAAFEDNIADVLGKLNTIKTTPPANLAAAYVYEQQLADALLKLFQLFHRLFRPDG